jgi:hypothetical protein
MFEIIACVVFVIGLIVSILHGIPNGLFEEEFIGTGFVMMLIIILFH